MAFQWLHWASRAVPTNLFGEKFPFIYFKGELSSKLLTPNINRNLYLIFLPHIPHIYIKTIIEKNTTQNIQKDRKFSQVRQIPESSFLFLLIQVFLKKFFLLRVIPPSILSVEYALLWQKLQYWIYVILSQSWLPDLNNPESFTQIM